MMQAAMNSVNLFILSGTAPDDLKKRDITYYKKDARIDNANYHPTSLASIACKGHERVIRDELTSHLKWQQLFYTALLYSTTWVPEW